MGAGSRRRIARRIIRPGATRKTAHLHIVIGHLEERDRHPRRVRAHGCRRVDHAVKGGDPAVIGPAHQKVADVHDETVGNVRHVDPGAAAAHDLQAAKGLLPFAGS